MDGFDVILQLKETVERDEPLVRFPLDENGRVCGPPEAVYAAPDEPPVN